MIGKVLTRKFSTCGNFDGVIMLAWYSAPYLDEARGSVRDRDNALRSHFVSHFDVGAESLRALEHNTSLTPYLLAATDAQHARES